MDVSVAKIKEVLGATKTSITVRSVLGVDIGTSAAKVVELQKDEKGKPQLLSYGAVELPKMEERHEDRIKSGTRSAAVIELLLRIKAVSRRAGFSLPNAATLVHTFETAKRQPDQMDLIMPHEAEEHLPVSVDSVSLEWHDLGLSAAVSATPKQKILLIAVRNDAREEAEALTKNTQLTSLFYEVEMFSASRAAGVHEGETALLVDFGAAATKLYLLNERGVAIAAYSNDIGGETFTKKIMEENKLSFAEAEDIKKKQGVLPESLCRKSIGEQIEKILWEGMRTANETLAPMGKKVEKVVLLGGGALMPGIAELAQHPVGAPIEIAKPFSLLQAPLILGDTLKAVDPLYTSAVGLALRALKATE